MVLTFALLFRKSLALLLSAHHHPLAEPLKPLQEQNYVR